MGCQSGLRPRDTPLRHTQVYHPLCLAIPVSAGRVARCAVRAHHKRHTNTNKSQLRQRHSAATQPPPMATTAPVPFPHHRRSNQAPCFEARQPLLHPPRKTKVAKSPQPQEPPAAPQHPPTAARGAGVGTQPPRPPHQATHRPERPTFYSHSPFPPATPRCWSCLPCSSPWSW